jgi:hypothetical protein
MSAHTRGPWIVDAELDVCAEGGELIASCFPMMSDYHAREGNARLIAAAPELLAALKWAMRGIPKYARRIKGQNEGYCDGWDAAHAAIAKAEELEPESTNSSAAPQPEPLASSGDEGADALPFPGGRE